MDRKIMLLSHTLTMRRNDLARLVEFCPVVSEKTDRWMDAGLTDLKNNVVLTHPNHEEK